MHLTEGHAVRMRSPAAVLAAWRVAVLSFPICEMGSAVPPPECGGGVCEGRPRQCRQRGAHWKLGKIAWTTAAGTLGGAELAGPPPPREPPSSGRGREELQNYRKGKRGVTVRSWRPRGRFHVQGKALAARVGSSDQGQGQEGGREGGGGRC